MIGKKRRKDQNKSDGRIGREDERIGRKERMEGLEKRKDRRIGTNEQCQGTVAKKHNKNTSKPLQQIYNDLCLITEIENLYNTNTTKSLSIFPHEVHNSTDTSIIDSVNVKLTHIFPVKVMQINEPTSGLRAGRMTISCKACLAVSCPAIWRKQKYKLQPHQKNTDNLFIGIYQKLHYSYQ